MLAHGWNSIGLGLLLMVLRARNRCSVLLRWWVRMLPCAVMRRIISLIADGSGSQADSS